MFCTGNDEELICGGQSKIKKIENYLFKYSDKIGEGNFSEVFSGIDQKTGECVAVKVVQISSMKSKVLSSLLRNEIAILKNLNHPNVIKCNDVLTSVNNCYIITEFCQNGDLEKLLRKNKRFQEKDITKFVYDIYKGLQYLASQNIIHRDLKIANIFMNASGVCKIADLGFAVKSASLFKDMSIGSPIYMSPEGLIRHEYGPKTDVWSFGVMLYELVHGDTPLAYCQSEQELRRGVVMPPKIRVQISRELRELIEVCMNPVESSRISVFQLHQTAQIRKVTALIEGIKLPKELTSTYHTSQKTLSVKMPVQLFHWVISYDDTIALIHYCRLLHKTTRVVSSPLLQQWLLTLSYELTRATIDSRCEKAAKAGEVLSEYHKKYQREHLVQRIDRTADEALIQCNGLIKAKNPAGKDSISVLIKDTEALRKYMRGGNYMSFAKMSHSEAFLSKSS